VKFHSKTAQGIKNFVDKDAAEMRGIDLDFPQIDLLENIEKESCPKWNLKI
jgi:catalase